jgi:hypothetical protein
MDLVARNRLGVLIDGHASPFRNAKYMVSGLATVVVESILKVRVSQKNSLSRVLDLRSW